MIESCADSLFTEKEKKKQSCTILHNLFRELSNQEDLGGISLFLPFTSPLLYLYLCSHFLLVSY